VFNLEQFFTRHRVEFRTQGPNCSRNFVNIACPFCRDDPSFHLRIHSEDLWYYCLRNSKHKGRGIAYILKTLRIEIPANLPERGEATEPKPAPKKDFGDFNVLFSPAEESEEALNYLRNRLFEDPAAVCRKYNLRVALKGKWAGRLLVPLTTGWTGRAMRGYLEPRYLSETTADGFFQVGRGLTVFLVEGPIDALRIATTIKDVIVIAMTGGRISSSILIELRKASTIYYVPDNNVPAYQRASAMQDIQMHCPQAIVKNTKLPPGVKDHGAMSELEVRQWAYTL
jgi:hypothetical protein